MISSMITDPQFFIMNRISLFWRLAPPRFDHFPCFNYFKSAHDYTEYVQVFESLLLHQE